MSGIDDLSICIPKCYLPLEEFAKVKKIDYNKLRHGLGLINMSIPDADEDIVSLAANALIDLLRKNPHVAPEKLKRIYVGTESQFDGSKPIASYLLGICNQFFNAQGLNQIDECDVTDTVFACIGAVDAMENCLHWLRYNPDDYAIVIATDIAKYAFNSSGEYTQGAGAVAILLSNEASLLDINLKSGVSSECTHDFFKPLRIAQAPLKAQDDEFGNGSVENALGDSSDSFKFQTIHSEFPVFDGPLSNESYKSRIQRAYKSFQKINPDFSILQWSKLVFHLPYAYQGRKVSVPFFEEHLKMIGQTDMFNSKYQLTGELSTHQNQRTVRSTVEYQLFVDKMISDGEQAASQVGNLYTGSLFLSLMSTLYFASMKEEDLSGHKLGLIAYGSGAKSKVFEATVQPEWKKKSQLFNLKQVFRERKELDYKSYTSLYFNRNTKVFSSQKNAVYLDHVGITNLNYGARHYKFLNHD